MHLFRHMLWTLTLYSLFLYRQALGTIDPNKLDIKLSAELAGQENWPRKFVWGSIAQIKGLDQWTDGQIVELANVAQVEATRQYDIFRAREKLGKKLKRAPPVTTVLVVDSTAYISTAARGGSEATWYFYNNLKRDEVTNLHPDFPCDWLGDALTRCSLHQFESARDSSTEGSASLPTAQPHRLGANCGEVLAAMAFCLTGSNRNLQGAKVVTVLQGNDNQAPGILPPCGAPGNANPNLLQEWGCWSLVSDRPGLGIRAIPVGTSPEDATIVEITVTHATYPVLAHTRNSYQVQRSLRE